MESPAHLRVADPPARRPRWNAPEGAHAPAPVVSVVTPAWNAAETLAETIASVAAQTWREFEMIVVDDGSTDHTPMVLAQHARRYRWISWCSQANAGAAGARET
ncbi:MAG TPA: glycosyltransferase, partial [Rhodanobacteraceae bacterium]